MRRARSADVFATTSNCMPTTRESTKPKVPVCLGKAWFLNHTAEHKYPDALIDGKEATVDEAIEAAADHLYNADMPLVYGMSNTTCEAQRECVAMADQLGALLDSHTSL